MKFFNRYVWLFGLITVSCLAIAQPNPLVATVSKVKPAVVGIGVYTPLGQPKNVLRGTGFAIGEGQYVVTNHHVLPKELDVQRRQEMMVFVGSGKTAQARKAELVAKSADHDLAILKIEGKAIPSLSLEQGDFKAEGSNIAFTGYPIGAVLGLYPVTHRGIIASVTPTVVPASSVKQISIKMLKRMRDPYLIYQLDATAYPGNSGSAMYDVETGQVIGIINKVFVKETKESVISKPSGITYAIPVKYLIELLKKHDISF